MTALILILISVCAGELCYILHIQRQLQQWLIFLRGLRTAPRQNSFVKGNSILADINFELNAILEEGRGRLVKLRRAENAQKALLTDLSHDVRTPLTSLSGYLEALESGTAEDTREYIHVAHRKASDLRELIDLLFQWSRLAAGEEQYQMKTCDINELTRELVIGHIPALEHREIALRVDIPQTEWFVSIDRTAYARILDNLLANAVRHGKCSLIERRIPRRKRQRTWPVHRPGAYGGNVRGDYRPQRPGRKDHLLSFPAP